MEIDLLRVVLTAFAVFLGLGYLLARRRRSASRRSGMDRPPERQLSFRKREKIIFYGRRLINKVRETSRKHRRVPEFARELLRLKKQRAAPRFREPSQSLLEVDLPGMEPTEQTLPAEIMYMLRNVRVLGHFEEPIFLEICRFIESRSIPANAFLFRIGDQDDSIYVIQSGFVRLYIAEADGTHSCVKEVHQGESIHSLLSVLDVLTGCQGRYKTVFAVASENSTVLRLPMKTLRLVLDRYPESLIRVVQIISVRLQRVTFLALHNYLGLCQELFNKSTTYATTSEANSDGVGQNSKRINSGETGINEDTGNTEDTGRNWEAERVEDAGRTEGSSTCIRQGSSASVDEVAAQGVQDAEANPFLVSDSGLGLSTLTNTSECLQTVPEESSLDDSSSNSRDTVCLSDASSSGLVPEEADMTALQHLAELLGIDDLNALNGLYHIRNCSPQEVLVKEGEHEDYLYLVISGRLEAKQRLTGNSDEQKTLYEISTGDLIGALAILTAEPSIFTVETLVETRVLCVDKKDFYAILKQRPQVILNMGQAVLRRMSPFVRQIDFALDWVFIEAGRALYRQKDKSDSVYIVLNGRLRSIYQLVSGKKELAGEHGRGELVGLVEALTQTDRSVTMMAVRDTELAQIPDGLLHVIKRRYPQVVTRLIQLLGQRILGHLVRQPNLFSMISKNPHPEPRPRVAKFSTVAVLPASDKVPLTNFTRELRRSLGVIGATLCLSRETVLARLGSSAFDGINGYRLSSWLSQQEDLHRMVLYECDFALTSWTHRCVRQADCILVVALADTDPSVGELEKQLEKLSSRAQKELILLHREDSPGPRDTLEWLSQRDWITTHYHIRCSKEILSGKTKKSRASKAVTRSSDFSRLARILTGTSIGLALGGGAARGCAHVGIIKAMVDADIPIDMIGGTSIGAFMGALWAQETNFVRFRRKARDWSMSMSSIWSLVRDITYPTTSLLTGKQFNRKIESAMRDCNIEDLWLPYFCVTTDITASKMRVHTQGCLWRYVRSSMSLAGYLPPLCDPLDGHLLLDGAYVNNVPADVMKTMGPQTVLAVDVSSETDTQFTNYGDELSGWWLLWRRLCPWVEKPRVPSLTEVQSLLAFVSCERLLEAIKTSELYDYIRPPISKYQSLDFAKFDEIAEVGHRFGKALMDDWRRTGRTQKLFARTPTTATATAKATSGSESRDVIVPPDSSFANLAQILAIPDDASHVTSSKTPTESISERGETEDKSDRISVASEPIFASCFDSGAERNKAGSEGASIASLVGGNQGEDEWSEYYLT